MRLWLRILLFVCGVIIGGASVGALLLVRLGVAPYDVLNSGIAKQSGLNIGITSWIVGAASILGAWALGRRPRPFSVAAVGGFGAMIYLMLKTFDEPVSLLSRSLILGLALIALWGAITLLLLARLGAGPAEELMLAIVERGVHLRHARWGIEAVLFTAGFALGGQVGVGTVILVLATGPVLAWALPPLEGWLHEPLHIEAPPVI
ncbi:unannotated protein [freshwater metagenome]|uniref:Unannotated protein n=1 Tax=freshwater metagenome TaxID=449393 RepID=A0A6J7KPW3_9ZZZZ|nr:hypothetical protein [Actinomycetota bacterium]